MPADPATASAVDIVARVRSREWSPVEVTEALLARIAEWEPHLNAFVDLDADGARRQARAAADAVARGDELGPLHGVPVTVKNIQAVAGLPTRRGSRLSDATPAPEDAPLVARLRAAGAIVVGTTTLPEQGWTAVGDSPLTGSTHTPWMHGRTSGGSSAGAGALAGAGCGPLHVGTDGAGSIRVPAAFCGAVGFKPTYGTVPYVPVPNNGSLSHAGPITRSVADAALMLSVMGGPDPRDHTSLPTTPRPTVEPGGLQGLRIAYSPDLGHARVDPEVAAVVERSVAALTDAGARGGPGHARVGTVRSGDGTRSLGHGRARLPPTRRRHRRADGSRAGRLHARLRALHRPPRRSTPSGGASPTPVRSTAGSATRAGTCWSRPAHPSRPSPSTTSSRRTGRSTRGTGWSGRSSPTRSTCRTARPSACRAVSPPRGCRWGCRSPGRDWPTTSSCGPLPDSWRSSPSTGCPTCPDCYLDNSLPQHRASPTVIG